MSISQTQESLNFDALFPELVKPRLAESYDDMGVRRPVIWWREQILSGALPWSAGSAAIQSWLRKDIWDGAMEIAHLDGGIEERRAALSKLPASIRPLVEKDLVRIWEIERRRS
jgi:hypothetical protein